MNFQLDQDQERFVKFAVVGISGTIVDFGFFNLFSINFKLPIILSSIFSFSIAVFNNFYWNRIWTYPESRQKSLKDQLLKFGVVSILGLIIRTPLFAIIEAPMIELVTSIFDKNFFISPEILGHNVALGIVIILVLFWNYFINRIWTYKNLNLDHAGSGKDGP